MTHSPASTRPTASAQTRPAAPASPQLGVTVLCIAAVLALLGRSSLRRAVPPVPEQTAASLRADVTEVTEALSRSGKE